ncbi:hypothetical protein K2173_027107 [Erythroxylum novogranatense]|uniref:Homeobox protein knotted-1-like 1 n=1 Tax=Erythroxylum novogranatense TaxID=1862640 RepID=A0AAV8U1K8_9ROSI|nr:hypothetical protein K2173_027107 [Erythroxylum novogranatense]
MEKVGCCCGEGLMFKCVEKMESEMSNSKENEVEDVEELKKRICNHPLYGLLVETHIDCLKVGSNGDLEMKQKLPDQRPCSNLVSQPDLDDFMEAYCMALSKLKEAMEEPQQETLAFLNTMHLQLKDLTITHFETPQPSTTSSGE